MLHPAVSVVASHATDYLFLALFVGCCLIAFL